MRVLFILCLLPTFAFAQQDSVTGTVSGHVYCADTQQPARFARIALAPLPPAGPTPNPTPQLYPAETRSDGSFFVTHVPPGDYYVSVTYPGYLSPEYQFSAENLLQPTPDLRKQILEGVPTLTVAANKLATISVTIHRGAAISGILRYDDGSPAADVEVIPLQRDATAHWAELRRRVSNNNLFENDGTDDLGHFRIHGLAPGEYTLMIERWAESQKGLTIYYGDAFLEKDAKVIKLTEGEESTGDDITIPISRLHTISGSIVTVSGQPINSGQITLYAMPGNIKIASAYVNEEDHVFYMDLVPEGTYTIRVTGARDVNRQIIRDPKDPNQIQNINETVLQIYGDYEAPFVVTGDTTGVNITVPTKPR